ncbi:prophage CP4-57 regulatory [Cupriavidus basilensis OR16]|uniref:Prophage CP4-57 regulatory n=1 Tax=Cupriavidus basilensis OR16 TaxID=1127483 RepID=H1S8D0_9BURK|nr:prophage CP4-57 regulatory [Cupriavidus basilensis OR16]
MNHHADAHSAPRFAPPAHVLAGKPAAERFMRLPEVIATCGLSRSSIYDGMRRGDFPQPVPLGGKSVAWLSSEIRQWMDSRIAARQK